MILSDGLSSGTEDELGWRDDLSFIVRCHWKSANHLKEAIQVFLNANLSEAFTAASNKVVRSSIDPLDDREFNQIRIQIASNPNTPPMVLNYLSKHSTPPVLERLAENPRTPAN